MISDPDMLYDYAVSFVIVRADLSEHIHSTLFSMTRLKTMTSSNKLFMGCFQKFLKATISLVLLMA